MWVHCLVGYVCDTRFQRCLCMPPCVPVLLHAVCAEDEGMSGVSDDEHSILQQHQSGAEYAETEAIAAAALAVNQGNPAAALIDLLNLMMKRSTNNLSSLQQDLQQESLSLHH